MTTHPPVSMPSWRALLRDLLFLAAGVAMASVGLKCFLLPNDILDGGATGVSLLTELLTGIDLSYVLLIVNIPFIILGSRLISGPFAIRSAGAIVCLAITVHYATFPTVTNDKLLIAVFGGFFLGSGIGLAIRGGGVLDGAEVLAVSISKRSSLTVGDVIALFNIILFSVATILVNIETAMYSMLTYFA
ncbi:MAG: YitT family protein, partial [Candidatus Kapaibacterium sp.]